MSFVGLFLFTTIRHWLSCWPCRSCFGYVSFGSFLSIFTSFKKLKKFSSWFLSWSISCSRLDFIVLLYYILLLTSSFIALWSGKHIFCQWVSVLFLFYMWPLLKAPHTLLRSVCIRTCWMLSSVDGYRFLRSMLQFQSALTWLSFPLWATCLILKLECWSVSVRHCITAYLCF